MKKVLSLLIALTIVSIPVISYASTSSEGKSIDSGCVELSMNPTSVTVSNNGTTTVNTPSGGIWKYGFTGTQVFSQYDHSTREHKSSVENSNAGSLASSGWKAPGKTAYKAIAATLKGNKAYYDTI